MFHQHPIFVEMGGILGISYMLRTTVAEGLRRDEAEDGYSIRKEKYGQNLYPLPHVRPFFEHCLDALEDMMLKVLIAAGIISIAAGAYNHPSTGWIEGLAILVCVAIVVFLSAINNHKSEVEFQKLAASLKGSKASVLRAGEALSVDQDEIFVGDIVFLSPGNMIPADGLVADNTTIRVNESAITGEPDEKVKNVNDPFLSAGTEVVDGTCAMLVTSVGINSAKGKIMAALSVGQEPTELQKRLEASSSLAGFVGLVCGVSTFLALFISFIVGGPDWGSEWTRIIDFFITSITVVIVAVPEGLPLAVTISMAYSMNKMREDQNLVKVLSACETMGNATTICSDKTGTLTQNKMTVVQTFIGKQYFVRQPQRNELSAPLHKLLIESIVLNSDRRVPQEKIDFNVPAEDWKWEGDGGATEAALLSWISRYHETKAENIMQQRVINGGRIIQFFPFSSAKKFSAVVIGDPIPDPNDDKKMTVPPTARMYFKGAADRIISKCKRYVDADGSVKDVPYPGKSLLLTQRPDKGVPGMCQWSRSGEWCNKWAVLGKKGSSQAICCADPAHRPAGVSAGDLALVETHPYKLMDNMTRSGLRCIAFAYVDNVPLALKDGQLLEPDENKGGEWTLVGLVGIKDPLRLETRGAVMTVQQAGIIVRMVTGDNLDTATFIAKDCGIISHPRHGAMEGADFRRALEDNEAHRARTGEDNPDFVELVTNLRVMARCQPDDKLELVKFLKEHDQIVGVTGDGSNDGPALKTANVGLAMGIAGTDVSKAAADIIILDDNFSSIVRSVMWGRSVYDNIRKFIQFQLSVNVVALVVALLGAIVTGDEPLKPVQLLWVNLVMDTMGALAIGTEIPKPDLLLRKPYSPGSNLISKVMYRNILGQAAAQLLVLLPMLFDGQNWFPEILHHWVTDANGLPKYTVYEDKLYTWVFNTFVWMQLCNEINSRKCNQEMNVFVGITDNAWFVSLFIIAGFLQVIIVEFFGVFMETVPQDWQLWFTALAFGATQLLSGYILRFFVCDVEEGQIFLAPDTFENAAWKEDPSLVGAMFKNYQAKDMREDTDLPASTTQTVYQGERFLLA